MFQKKQIDDASKSNYFTATKMRQQSLYARVSFQLLIRAIYSHNWSYVV